MSVFSLDMRTAEVLLLVQVPKGTPSQEVLGAVDGATICNPEYPTVSISSPTMSDVYLPYVMNSTVVYAMEAVATWNDSEGLDPYMILECAHTEVSDPWMSVEITTVLDVQDHIETS